MESRPQSVSRRQFIQRTALASAAGLAVPYVVSASALAGGARTAPSDKLRVALIGAGGMGRANLDACGKQEDVVVTAVCDVWKERRDAVCAQYSTAKPYADFRELLAASDVDGVIIATPPHWHCLIAVAACEAGKDLYIQKPMTLYVDETLAIKRAVAKYGRISQVGTQIHAGANYRRVVERVRSGQLGPINVVRTFNVMNQGIKGLGTPPASVPPADLDWDLWVGPAPMCAYNPLITRSAYENCSFMAFSGGWTPGMAPHIIDLPIWALELGVPVRTSCMGSRRVIQDAGDAPDMQEVIWEYPQTTLHWSMNAANSFGFDFGRGAPERRLGIYFHGVNGTLYADYGMHQIVGEGDAMKDASAPPETLPPSPGHEREWLNCIRTREQPSCCVDYHYRLDLAINLANLSMRLGRDVRWDPVADALVSDAEAAKLARPEYRSPWQFPNV